MDERVGYFRLAHGHAAASAAKPAGQAPRRATAGAVKSGRNGYAAGPKALPQASKYDLITEAANRRRSGWRAAASLHCLERDELCSIGIPL
jgi:hypothetical protein